MTIRDLAFVGCRLVSVCVVLDAIRRVPEILAALLVPASGLSRDPLLWLVGLTGVVVGTVWVVAGAWLWRNADRVARAIAGPHADAVAQIEPSSRDALQHALFAAVGLFVAIGAAGELAGSCYARKLLERQGFEAARLVEMDGDVLRAVVELVLGVALVLGASGFSGALARLRAGGASRAA